MSSSNQLSAPVALTTDDVEALKKMLEHKLRGVPEPKVLYTIEEIVNGVQDVFRPYTT